MMFATRRERQPGLLRAEELTGSAQLHVHLSNIEPIVRLDQGTDALASRVAELACYENAVALLSASADATPQLM